MVNLIEVKELAIWYDGKQAVKKLSLEVRDKEILGVIGPSNSGKTSFLKTLNRLNELYPDYRCSGEILLGGENIFKMDKHLLRKKDRHCLCFAAAAPVVDLR